MTSFQFAADASTSSFCGFGQNYYPWFNRNSQRVSVSKPFFLTECIQQERLILFFPVSYFIVLILQKHFFPLQILPHLPLSSSHLYINTSASHNNELHCSVHASNTLHTMWKAKCCHLSCQLQKEVWLQSVLPNYSNNSINNKELYSDLTLVLYSHICTDYKASCCRSYHRITEFCSQALAHTHWWALWSHTECFWGVKYKSQTRKSHTGKGYV